MKPFRLIFRLCLFALWTVCLVPFQLILLCFTKEKYAYYITQLWHKGVLKIANTKIIITGNIPKKSRNFYVGNHFSSMDIPILGSVIRASFVAKADVESYPIFGFLASIQQTVFISRNQTRAKLVMEQIKTMIVSEKDLIVFPEGTSTDASHIMPFKSSLFSVPIECADTGITINPFTLELLSVEGSTDLTRTRRNLFTLSPDVEFWQNFISIFSLSEAVVRLHFYDPIIVSNDDDRKALAQKTYEIVANPPLLPL